MPAFAKNPKFVIGTIVALWVLYVLYANFQPKTVDFYLLPFGVMLEFKLSTVIIGAAIFGSVATLVIQWLWRRSSNAAPAAVVAPAPSTPTSTTVPINKTVA
jgi:hypothetical protein